MIGCRQCGLDYKFESGISESRESWGGIQPTKFSSYTVRTGIRHVQLEGVLIVETPTRSKVQVRYVPTKFSWMWIDGYGEL